jgi:hypothetical protein
MTPRSDEPSAAEHDTSPAPPAWGMGEGARPGSGSPRRVGVPAQGVDALLLVLFLLIWTGVFVFFFAQR